MQVTSLSCCPRAHREEGRGCVLQPAHSRCFISVLWWMNECRCHCSARTRERKRRAQTWHAMIQVSLLFNTHVSAAGSQAHPGPFLPPSLLYMSSQASPFLKEQNPGIPKSSFCKSEVRGGAQTSRHTRSSTLASPFHAWLCPVPTAFLTAPSMKTQWGNYSQGTKMCCSWLSGQH